MEKKLRLQLFDSEGRMGIDRLVSQDPEFNAGPKFKHHDPIRVEFTLFNKEDVDKCKKYLDQLSGELPLTERKSKKVAIDTGDNREEVLTQVMGQMELNQDLLIKDLRERGFRFMMYDYLKTLEYNNLPIKERHQEEYQWMLLSLKQGKNPKTDKYDPMLAFGFNLLGERTEKVLVYLNGEFHQSYKVPLPEKPKETFKKSGMTKFPKYMMEDERERFRFELRKLELEPEKNPTKFFNRWWQFVENLPGWVAKRCKE